MEKYNLYSIKTKQYAGNSLIPKYAAINHFMNYLGKDYKLDAPKKQIKNKIPLTRDEIQALFKASETHPRDHAILTTLYFTQLRRTELINLNRCDIDFERKKIRVNEGKGNESAEINIHTFALDAISHYLETRNTPTSNSNEALFQSKKGKRICKNSIACLIKKYAAQTGIEKRVYPHLFRISSITHMAERGLNFEEIIHQSRHRTYETLKSYVQMSDDHIKQAYLKGLSFDKDKNAGVSETVEHIVSDNTNANINSNLKINYKQELVKRLASGDITNDAFMAAVNLLKDEAKSLDNIKGYQ